MWHGAALVSSRRSANCGCYIQPQRVRDSSCQQAVRERQSLFIPPSSPCTLALPRDPPPGGQLPWETRSLTQAAAAPRCHCGHSLSLLKCVCHPHPLRGSPNPNQPISHCVQPLSVWEAMQEGSTQRWDET